MKGNIHSVENLKEHIFDESFLQCGDVIKKANGEQYIITKQDISHYTIRRFLQPTELIKCITTTMQKL